jgi:hypothetical protein
LPWALITAFLMPLFSAVMIAGKILLFPGN